MKRITATAMGIALAASLSIAAPQDTATELVNRYFSATTEAALAATWKDWHPDATHHIKVITGFKNGDFEFSYPMSDWEKLPNWMEDPEVMKAMQGYEEISHSEPDLTISSKGAEITVTAQSKVNYVWDGYKGKMTQTDRFTIITTAGRTVIRNLNTVYDYR